MTEQRHDVQTPSTEHARVPPTANWLQRKIWLICGVLQWTAFLRMTRFQQIDPDLTPAKMALVRVAMVCVGLLILNTGWTPASYLGLIPIVFGLIWLLLIHPFIRGEHVK